MRFSVVIPTLNEAENIEGIISRILANTGGLEVEIVVVDDGSKDETQAIVRRLGATLPVKLLARERPKDGLAGAVLAGARAASEEAVLIIDADGSHPPEKIPDLVLPVLRGERDMVIGSRYMPGGSTPGWSRKRRLMSRAASACAWPLTDVHDALSGFFAVRRELLASIPADAAGFKIALEVLVRGGDSLRVGEVPIAFRDRELGQSKMGTGVILTYFRRLLALSGWRESQDTVGLGLAKTALVWAVHWAVFAIAWKLHGRLAPSTLPTDGLAMENLLGFIGGAGLNIYLKTRQHTPAAAGAGNFVERLVIVSLLSFFLLSGVLWALVSAFDWPALAAVIPAIVVGWSVMFLGYALFVWPMRQQYGSGIRWRVSGLGAAAYLFALRLAYLYGMPMASRIAQPPEQRFGVLGGGTAALRKMGMALLGPTSAGGNLPALGCWLLAAWFVFKAAQELFDKTVAFRALLLFSVLPVFFGMGAIFTPETLPLTAWALILWGAALLRRQEGVNLHFIAAIAGSALLWMPRAFTPGQLTAMNMLGFFGWQLILITPVPIVSAVLTLSSPGRAQNAKTRAACDIGAIYASAAFLAVLAVWLVEGIGKLAVGAIWLPLIPLVAAEMERGGRSPGRSWARLIYFCILAYGGLLYWHHFVASA